MDPQGVRHRAEEVQDHPRQRLHRRPAGKTYSVPKPDGVTIPRTNDELPPGNVRTIRERIARQRLLPAGFIKAADATYVRRQDERVHLIYFKALDQKISVHFGFHFTFIPPLSAAKPIPLNEFRQLECAGESWIGSFISDQDGFRYGHDPVALEATLTSACNLAVALLDRFAREWADLSAVLALIDADPPPRQWHLRDREIVAACILKRLGRADEGNARMQAWQATWPNSWHINKLMSALETGNVDDWVLPPTTPAAE